MFLRIHADPLSVRATLTNERILRIHECQVAPKRPPCIETPIVMTAMAEATRATVVALNEDPHANHSSWNSYDAGVVQSFSGLLRLWRIHASPVGRRVVFVFL